MSGSVNLVSIPPPAPRPRDNSDPRTIRLADGRNSESVLIAVLEGGPEMRNVARVREVPVDVDKIKIPHYGGYEHFERVRSDVPNEGRPVVFRWSGRTRVAE